MMKVPTNLGNDHEFIINEYSRRSKQSHDSLCLEWTISYHCGES